MVMKNPFVTNGYAGPDFITQQDDAYVVYDKFFDLWLKNYMK